MANTITENLHYTKISEQAAFLFHIRQDKRGFYIAQFIYLKKIIGYIEHIVHSHKLL